MTAVTRLHHEEPKQLSKAFLASIDTTRGAGTAGHDCPLCSTTMGMQLYILVLGQGQATSTSLPGHRDTCCPYMLSRYDSIF